MSLDGIDDGVAGLEAMYADGVFGGSTLGIAFFQASVKLESATYSACRSVANGRRHLIVVALARNRELCRNIVGRDYATEIDGVCRK